MKNETFFEKFDQLSEASNAVPKVRELVLRLATGGRLTEQDPFDQPALELLAEIFEIRDQLILLGKSRNRRNGSMIPAGDTMEIPSSWQRCTIGEVCDLQTGATPSTQEPTFFDGDVPWLVSGDVNKGEIFECDGRISKLGLENSNCKIIPRDSVLIALNGQGKTRATVALLRIDAALNQSLVAMIPYSRDHLMPEYLFWNLRGRYYAIREITGQDQRRGLNMKLVGQLSLPIPPIAEQRRIVTRVNELMVLCDQLEWQQQERDTRQNALARASLARFAGAPIPANLGLLFPELYVIPPEDLRKTVLSLAVQGKLVPQDPNDEDVNAQLALSDEERSRIALSDHRAEHERLELLGADDRWDIPGNWEWRSLGDLVLFIDYRGKTPNKVQHGVRLITAKNVKKGFINLSPEEFLSEQDYTDWMTRGLPQLGDILFTTEAPMGNVATVSLTERFALAQRIICFRNYGAVQPEFLVLQLLAQPFQTILERAATGMTAKGIKASKLKRLPIAVPPLAEQRRIVAKVEQLTALIAERETQLTTLRSIGEALMEAVVAELIAAQD